jgi:hypothetical protein
MSRSNYWSCSPLADWIRGTAKPYAETGEGWDEWRERAKTQYPVRYWIAEEGLDILQDIVNWPMDKIHSIRYYINNRWITRSHALTAHPRDIPRGEWRDVGNRFLPCLFNELVDFVEVEQAWHNVLWDKEKLKEFGPPWYRKWFGLRGWRSRESGLDYLNWAGELRIGEDWGVDPDDKDYGQLTPQAKNAREIKELYLWWTEVYPNRPDPYDASGWTAVCEEVRIANGSSWSLTPKDPKLKKKQDRAHKLLHKLEKQYEEEDTAMMIRLIKVRNSLWT